MRFYFNYFFGWAKKILIVVMVYFAVISLFAYFINKDKPVITEDPIKKNRVELYKIVNDAKLNETKEGKLASKLYKGMFCVFIGEVCTDNPNDGDRNFNRSIFGYISKAITLPFTNPPASGMFWAYTSLQNAGFIPQALAAEGIGFASIRPFMNLWKIFRDLAYMFVVLILIAIGFMIMFRTKINPQTVINIENALPRIVVSLILITFSFAIAGFLIDMMYIIIFIAIAAIGARGNHFNIAETQTAMLNADIWQIGQGLIPGRSLWDLSNSVINTLPLEYSQIVRIFGSIAGFFLTYRFLFPMVSDFSRFIGNLGASIPGADTIMQVIGMTIWTGLELLLVVISPFWGYFIIPIILMLLIFCTVMALFFRIFFLLFKTYLEIFLMIIFAPIFLLFEAIPGKSAFSYWLKNLIANLLTFPLIITLFLIGRVMVNTSSSIANGLWSPPLLGNLNPNSFTVILSMGILFLIPDIIKLFKEFMGVKGIPISPGIGTFFGGATAGVGGGIGLLGQFGSASLGLNAIGGLKDKLIKMGGLAPPNVNTPPARPGP